jgi:hypothetical protein
MTLKITPDEIQIRNSNGQVKFTNKNSLLYLIDQGQGTTNVTPGTVYSTANYYWSIDSDRDNVVPRFSLTTIKFLSGDGAIIQSLLNKEIQLNGNMTIYLNGRREDKAGVADSQVLSADFFSRDLKFSHTGFASSGQVTGSLINMSFAWKTIIIGYKK